MAVGGQATSATVDVALTNVAVQMRAVMQQAVNLSTWINGQGTGLATLEALGYTAADAATALSMISYLNTVAGVYFGTASQGTAFDFNQELAQVWAGQ